MTNKWLFAINSGIALIASFIFLVAFYVHFREVSKDKNRVCKDLVYPAAFTVQTTIPNSLWRRVLEYHQLHKKYPSP